MKKYLLPIVFISLLFWSCSEEPKDCAGIEGGSASVDSCGTCDDDPTNDCIEDCAGVFGGSASVDSCGICDDDSSNNCIQDCSGEWGGLVFDCGGGCDENIYLWDECYNIESTTHLEFNDDRQGEIPSEIGQLINLTRFDYLLIFCI